MLSIRLLLCATVLCLSCVQYGDAWLHSWSWGSHTVRGEVSGVPGLTRRWSIGIRWTYRFARKGDVLQLCEQLASAVVTRQQWNAIAPRRQLALDGAAEEVFVWHTGSDTCNLVGLTADQCQSCLEKESCTEQVVRALQDDDFKQGKDDIKYNFLISQDGVIYEGRGWDVIGQHTTGKNSKSIGIALIGDFSKTEPSQAAQDALNSLIGCGKATDEVTPAAQMTTGPQMAGKAFYDMLTRCGGLCVRNGRR